VDEAQSKYERWQKILCEAAEQSHRGLIPTLEPTVKFAKMLAGPPVADVCRLIPWEDEKGTTLRQALNAYAGNKVEILIGPEGGFSVEEVKLATQAGFSAVTLGARILRMETAAMAATALVLYERGEMDSASGQAA
jgi:16S rRNA (uracil1498-N3)-methyltransferase